MSPPPHSLSSPLVHALSVLVTQATDQAKRIHYLVEDTELFDHLVDLESVRAVDPRGKKHGSKKDGKDAHDGYVPPLFAMSNIISCSSRTRACMICV